MKKKVFKAYKNPFSAEYWRDAARELANVKSLCVAAVLCAMAIAVEQLNIKLSPSLQVSLSFVPIALCSAMTGPLLAIPCGVIVDITGALIGGYVPFFFGYTLTAVLSAFIYAIFLYRSDLSFVRIALAKFCVNLFVNVLLGSLWRAVLYGNFYSYYVAISGVKNVALFPAEVVILCLVTSALARPLASLGYGERDKDAARFTGKRIAFLIALTAVAAAAITLFSVYFPALKEYFSPEHPLTYEGGAVTLFEDGLPERAKAGETVELRTKGVIHDADIKVFVNGEEIKTSRYDSDCWTFEFTMPDKDAAVKLELQ